MATPRIVFPLRVYMLSSAPFELPKLRAGAGGKGYKIALLLLLSYMPASHRKWVLPRSLWHCEICLSPAILLYAFLNPQMLAQSCSRHLSPAAPRLERINPLSRNLFCFQLIRVDAYPRLSSLRVRLLSMARFNY